MKFRKARFELFTQLFWNTFENSEKIKILDVGGTEDFWKDQEILKSGKVDVIILNLSKEPVSTPHIFSVAGDATDLSEFADNSIDLVFSNSVIEHLYTWDNQILMAKEIRRVGKKHFVQTPNKYFFLEPHYALPYFQFCPKELGYTILTKTNLSRFKKWESEQARQYLEEIRLISEKEMKQLFPLSKIHYEKFVGLNKSFYAHNLNHFTS
ncbi:methyltransferase domain-containing protein [Echinicola shivajiensis]|uniref:methyltransferase domain-containing protein n=1 Tax=Echinicola shivajiensis TaxID=1035916 RepID=UPI001FEAEDDD|nr:methyltransferase domain-containing protein [Echinicola shivajiensis]